MGEVSPGDSVLLRYVMGEDGAPYLSAGTSGVVRGVYGDHVLVERDFDGELVDAIEAQAVDVVEGGPA